MKLKIGKTHYAVTSPDVIDPRGITRGRVNYEAKTIQVALRSGFPLRKISPLRRREVFWHEVIHAALKDMGSHKEADEVFVDNMAQRIAQVYVQIGSRFL